MLHSAGIYGMSRLFAHAAHIYMIKHMLSLTPTIGITGFIAYATPIYMIKRMLSLIQKQQKTDLNTDEIRMLFLLRMHPVD